MLRADAIIRIKDFGIYKKTDDILEIADEWESITKDFPEVDIPLVSTAQIKKREELYSDDVAPLTFKKQREIAMEKSFSPTLINSFHIEWTLLMKDLARYF